jgi:hypothetical protein
MASFAGIQWVRVLVGGFLAELTVFAIWVSRRIESRFLMHGLLVGVVAALIYLGLAWGQPQPLLYNIAHGLKLVGGAAGGLIAARRFRATA